MTAYLIVDVDDLLQRLEARGLVLDIQTIATSLLNAASLAAGLGSPDELMAIAVADWNRYRRPSGALVSVCSRSSPIPATICLTCPTVAWSPTPC